MRSLKKKREDSHVEIPYDSLLKEEARQYIRQQLKLAGGRNANAEDAIFDQNAIESISRRVQHCIGEESKKG